MLNLIEQIFDYIVGFVTFSVSYIQSLFQTLLYIPQFYSSIMETVAYLPDVLVMFAYLTVTLVVLNYVIGRSS